MNKELKEDADNMLNDDEKKDPRDKVDSVYLKFKIRTGRCARQVILFIPFSLASSGCRAAWSDSLAVRFLLLGTALHVFRRCRTTVGPLGR